MPFLADAGLGRMLTVDSLLVVPDIRGAVSRQEDEVEAWVVNGQKAERHVLRLGRMTDEERRIILAGCLINFYNS